MTYALTVSCRSRIILTGKSLDKNALHKALDLIEPYEKMNLPITISAIAVMNTPTNSLSFVPLDEFMPMKLPIKYKYGYIIPADGIYEDEDEDEDEEDEEVEVYDEENPYGDR